MRFGLRKSILSLDNLIFEPLEFRKLQPIEDTLTLQSRYNRMIVYSHEQGLIGVKMLQIRGKARRFLCSSFLGRCTAACLLAATGKARTRFFLLQGKQIEKDGVEFILYEVRL